MSSNQRPDLMKKQPHKQSNSEVWVISWLYFGTKASDVRGDDMPVFSIQYWQKDLEPLAVKSDCGHKLIKLSKIWSCSKSDTEPSTQCNFTFVWMNKTNPPPKPAYTQSRNVLKDSITSTSGTRGLHWHPTQQKDSGLSVFQPWLRQHIKAKHDLS